MSDQLEKKEKFMQNLSPDLTGVPLRDVLYTKLRRHGLRPTKQRLALAQLIFGKGHRHITAEDLHKETTEAGFTLSLATVYNSLQRFYETGLLRIIIGEGSKRWFDTNLSDHHHFYMEDTQTILDAPISEISSSKIDNLPNPPEGMEIAQIDLMIKLRRKTAKHS